MQFLHVLHAVTTPWPTVTDGSKQQSISSKKYASDNMLQYLLTSSFLESLTHFQTSLKTTRSKLMHYYFAWFASVHPFIFLVKTIYNSYLFSMSHVFILQPYSYKYNHNYSCSDLGGWLIFNHALLAI